MNYRKQSEFSNFYYKSDIFFFVCGILMLCSEIWKQLTLTVAIGGGKYIWWYFPFQLCSIPMYILLVYPWLRRRNARLTLLAFLMSYSLLGGIAQGGGAKDVIGAFDEKGLGAIVNSSRAVLTAWQKQNRPGSEYAAAARDEAIRMRDDITQYLPEIRL